MIYFYPRGAIDLLLGCNTVDLARSRGDKEALRILAGAGFDCVDYNLSLYGVRNELDSFWLKNFDETAEYIKEIKLTAERAGIFFGQLHSPYPTYFENKARLEEVRIVGERSIEICALLESPYIVIHPNVPPKCPPERYFDEAMAPNFKYFSSFIPALKRTGVKVAIENMFNWDFEKDIGLETVASRAENMVYIIDELNKIAGDELFVACLDTGHAMISGGGDIPAMIKTLGSRLKLLHLHDNDGRHDKHFVPFKGVIDWRSVCGALRENGYRGTLSLEVNSSKDAGEEKARELYEAAKKLNAMIERA